MANHPEDPRANNNGNSNSDSNGNNRVDDLLAQADTGGRQLTGALGILIAGLAFIWSVFQLFIASNLPFTLTEITGINLIFNNVQARIIFLAFALALAALAFPLTRSSLKHTIPAYDWLLIILGVSSCFYLLIEQNAIATRAGAWITSDVVVSLIGLTVLMIAVFRSLGLPLVIVASVFLLYVFFGSSDYLPEAIQWKGASLKKAMGHFWMQTEGVFGVALGVGASMIFLFVLFGAILEKAGAGNYFIKIAFALLGHLRGGPAKAAVVASALSGIYSGSSIANTVTTGTFTIPLMKRTGFSAEKAGAVEVASSTNGQLTPPVMGAAAFLISEFTGVSYQEVVRHALLPAVISYIALIYIVHLEACKLDLQGLPKQPSQRSLMQKVIGFLTGFIGIAILFMAVYYGLGWIKVAYPELTFNAALGIFFLVYVILLAIASRQPDLELDDPNAELVELPRAGPTALTGLYYLLPIVILIWCILIERFSPGLSAYWACIAMIFIALTQHPIKAIMRGQFNLAQQFSRGFAEFINGMISGARNMISIGVATGVAGVIVGTISLTGAHQVVGEFVEFLSGGNLMVMLVLVAIMSLILGMGLPTTANYIVVSSLMAPVIVALGAKTGLIVPLIAVHMFVFYFGILADDTPPVGLAAFAAAAISGGDPIKTGIQGFTYDIRTAILPFLFIFNTELLLIDVTLVGAIFVFIVATIAMLLFAAATQGWFLTRSRIWESLTLLLIAFTLFRPGFWLDRWQAEYSHTAPNQLISMAAEAAADSDLRITLKGPDFDNPDQIDELTLNIPLGAKDDDGAKRLEKTGLLVQLDGEKVIMEEPLPGSDFTEKLQGFDFYGDQSVEVTGIIVANERWPKEVFYIPALLLLAVIILLQKGRRSRVTAMAS